MSYYSILQSRANQRAFGTMQHGGRGEFRVMVYGPLNNYGNAHWLSSGRLAPFGWNGCKPPHSALYAIKVRPKPQVRHVQD